MVLWLDDSYFEDEPMLRMPLLFEPLVGALTFTDPNLGVAGPHRGSISLIGPWRSSTLRRMLPSWRRSPALEAAGILLPWDDNKSLRTLTQDALGWVSLYCATPSVMDEALVSKPGTIREVANDYLKKEGFREVHNLTATDAELAFEVFSELELRKANLTGTDPKQPPGHIVLISEWDTFYARTMSLTYGAELARRLDRKDPSAWLDYVSRYVDRAPGLQVVPENFHSFVYLRGLDGQTVGKPGDRDEGEADRKAARSSPASFDDLRHWTPDSNRAQGQAQFDYLGRLGDRIMALEDRLQRENRGRVTAIGIVGSDVFDTLLILQALRDRFPNTLFFTTDLDVRFAHPSERGWARNLIVASSYGLELAPELQGQIAPFRDSKQTALFAAALAALGEPHLSNLTGVSARRFEIGNSAVVDLSTRGPMATARVVVPEQLYPDDSNEPQVFEMKFALHPETPQEQLREAAVNRHENWLWCALFGALTVVGLCWLVPSLRNLSFSCLRFPSEALVYSEEDIGGPEGAAYFVQQLGRKECPVIGVFLRGYLGDLIHQPVEFDRTKITDPAILDELERDTRLQRKWVEEQKEKWQCELARRMVAGLNYLMEKWVPDEETPPSNVSVRGPREGPVMRFWRRRKVRRKLDAELAAMSVDARPGGNVVPGGHPAVAAADAREAALGIYRLRLRRLVWMILWAGAFGYIARQLGRAIWFDSTFNPRGEPFSLVSGISAWPAVIVRFVEVALAVLFLLILRHNGRENFYRLSRIYRLPVVVRSPEPMPNGRVCAARLWNEYRIGRNLLRVIWRVSPPIICYFGMVWIVFVLSGGVIMYPVRGNAVAVWNDKIVLAGFVGFLLLSFVTLDAARGGSRLIRRLTGAPTDYPTATRQHFRRLRGDINPDYLDEWIDLQLIADLTEYLSALVYFPSILLVLLIAARNSWWDNWPWAAVVIVIFSMNFVLSAAGIVLLQRAAQRAKREATASLDAKIKQLARKLAASPAENDQSQAGKLLEEIRGIERGAFVSFWNSPVIGALFLSSGGTTAIQALIWFMGR
ncbi:MAG TPA: hypothetical protein VFJ90_10990 [Candidatus Didemnitutus sp.]|nr:hypothetical protein [Candidatus Didemnitutus sp.]